MMMNRKTMLIIDLRDPNQYDAGHILNAKSFTLAALQLECDKLTRNKDKPILIYGSRQSEVARAVTMLKAKGFTEVYHLSGGITAWQKDNLPLVKSATLEVNHG
jgi:rhodanese-related sulfurtransferase